jgi:predicted TIM-barrel fold metal-dependent hydrolase
MTTEPSIVRPKPPRVFDVHVHLFPPMLARFIWKWFEDNAWSIRHKPVPDETFALLGRYGVERMVGLCYAHAPDLSGMLNDFMAQLVARHPERLVGFGTVLPGEPGIAAELRRALVDLDLAGIKIHCHVQRIAPDDDRMQPVFDAVAETGKVLQIHCGAVSESKAHPHEIDELCAWPRFVRALQRVPELRIIVPHIGYDEVQPYLDLLDEFPNLYFDTAMAFGGYRVARGEALYDARPLALVTYDKGRAPPLPEPWKPALEQLVPQILARPERFLFGSDFPNLPYDPDLEVRELARYLPEDVLQMVLWDNAVRLFGPGRSMTDRHGD